MLDIGLDIKRNEDDSLSFGVYRKSTNSGRYLDFNAYHHAGHKRSVVMSLNDRADKLCSDQIQLNEEMSKIMNYLKENNYHRSFQQKTMQRSKTTEPAPGPSRHIPIRRILKEYLRKLADC